MLFRSTKHEWDGKQFNHTDDCLDGDGAGLVIFAKVLAQRERDACAQLCQTEIDRVKPLYSVVAENALKAIQARWHS